MRRLLIWASYTAGILVIFAGGLKAVDFLLLRDPAAVRGTIGDPRASGMVARGARVTVNTFDFYPWTGGHTQANTTLYGGRFRTGDHGFFIDFDLDRPPPKAPGELRMLWTGGSAAAGWGATDNDSMMFKVIERHFNATRPCGKKNSLRIINLAMGGSKTYQNFIALNRWGHALEPDMIVSFSGHNDMDPVYREPHDVWRGYFSVLAMTLAYRADAGPRYLQVLSEYFPGLVFNTPVGRILRSLDGRALLAEARRRYRKVFPPPAPTPEEALNEVAIPAYVHALSSIERDFRGIPVAVIFQPYMATDENPGQSAPKGPLTRTQWTTMYERFIKQAIIQLEGSSDGEWYFFDAHDWYRKNMAGRFEPGDGVHLDAKKQRELGLRVAAILFPVLCRHLPPRRDN